MFWELFENYQLKTVRNLKILQIVTVVLKILAYRFGPGIKNLTYIYGVCWVSIFYMTECGDPFGRFKVS